MLDGEETVQIACGKLRWEERDSMLDGEETARGNSLRRASLGGMLDGEETVEIAWESFAKRERDSMLDGEEIACGKLRWEGARACWTDRKRWK